MFLKPEGYLSLHPSESNSLRAAKCSVTEELWAAAHSDVQTTAAGGSIQYPDMTIVLVPNIVVVFFDQYANTIIGSCNGLRSYQPTSCGCQGSVFFYIFLFIYFLNRQDRVNRSIASHCHGSCPLPSQCQSICCVADCDLVWVLVSGAIMWPHHSLLWLHETSTLLAVLSSLSQHLKLWYRVMSSLLAVTSKDISLAGFDLIVITNASNYDIIWHHCCWLWPQRTPSTLLAISLCMALTFFIIRRVGWTREKFGCAGHSIAHITDYFSTFKNLVM